MESTQETEALAALIEGLARATDHDQAMACVLAQLPVLSGAHEIRVVPPGQQPSPASRQESRYVEHHLLPGPTGTLVMSWTREPRRPDLLLQAALAAVGTALALREKDHELEDLVARVDHAQQLAAMGDYDWHVTTDTNHWSDQLYRIYGYEPQTFNASYDRFLSLLHPDDQPHVMSVHQEAYRTGEPYQMVERIIRPDGEIRHLASNGQVMRDADGRPVRFRGTCIDITDRVLAEQQREQLAARFRRLVESAPDAILVLDEEGRILEANPRAHQLLRGSPIGHEMHELLGSTAAVDALGVAATGLDGTELLLDVTTAAVTELDTEQLVAVFLRDARDRLAGEALAASLREAQLRRRQALEINDAVVQGLVTASYALETDDPGRAAEFLADTLDSARAMMDDLLRPLDGEGLAPGDLVRRTPARVRPEGSA